MSSIVEIKRKKGESFEGLMRRFSRRISASGKLLEARKVRFHTPEPNKNKVRDGALRRIKIRDKREWLIKTGQLIEDKMNVANKKKRR